MPSLRRTDAPALDPGLREARGAIALANAKVNLVLRVLAKEPTGYHKVETLFARLALSDHVSVRVDTGNRSLTCDGPAMPAGGLGPPEENLAWRAASAFAEHGWPRRFSITISKNIPVGAGLGGGSADAGAVLRILSALRPTPLPAMRVASMAAQLGADVSFLTAESPMALAWGRGERLLALPPLPSAQCWVLVPPFAVSTREAYTWLDDERSANGPSPRPPMSAEALGSWDAIAALATNDFGPVVGRRHPSLAQALEHLRARGARVALLAGSGSSVFGVFDPPITLHDLAAPPELGRWIETATMADVVPLRPID
ncbi:MAG: 4-(cytidine 5'-diphospho)-2-C-methyl-D-erythritol kinase [Gemmatimonadaceae bacterium]